MFAIQRFSIITTGGRQISRQRRRGAATLELALTLGILVNLTFGMVEFGYFFFVKNTMQGAAREGARAGIVAGAVYTASASTPSITTSIQNAMSAAGFSNTAKYSFTVTDSTTGTTITTDTQLAAVSSGDALAVTVQGTWSVIGAGFRPMNLIGSAKIVSGTAVMRHE